MCFHAECKEAAQGGARSSSESPDMKCTHISLAIEASSHFNDVRQRSTNLSSTVLQDVPFPPNILAEFKSHVTNDNLDKIIHQVSDQCFVVQTTPTSEAPLGLLHVRVNKNKKFHCTCNKFKHMSSLCGGTTALKVSKRCFHIYICLWAVFSDPSMKDEFSLCLFSDSKSGSSYSCFIRNNIE